MKLKVRAFDASLGKMITEETSGLSSAEILQRYDNTMLALFYDDDSPVLDKNNEHLYEGDILEFQDKWEWYRGEWAAKFHFATTDEKIKLRKEYDALPTEKRVVELSMIHGVSFSIYDLKEGRFVKIGNIYESVKEGTQEEIQEQVKEELRKLYGRKKAAFRITDIFEPSQRIDPSVLFE